jgi:hypothetical protein
MAQTQTNTSQPIYPVRLSIEACKTDDVSLMAQAISIASSPESCDTVQEVIRTGLRRSAARGATRVLSYLLDQGADVSTITAGTIVSSRELVEPSREVLEILIAHGWDIDNRGDDKGWPLLWYVVRYPDLLAWCLAHGASVYLPGDTPLRNTNGIGCEPRLSLLELAAEEGTVATFELLRARGAPLGRRTLHVAVEHAAIHAPPYDSVRTALFEERMDMVRHLVDMVGLDVDAEECWPGKSCATPLCYVASYNSGKDARELIWFLLDRGADPNRAFTLGGDRALSALEQAQRIRNTRFLEAVQEWQARQHNNTT